MPTHVYANNNEVASKASDGKSTAAFPDVCFSPPAPPVGPLPLPYPNTAEVKDTDKGTAKVFIKDKMSGMADDSYMSKSMGDEAATQNFNKGLITGALQGKGYFGLWSMDVQMEGKGVPRHLDMVTHNHGSKPGNSVQVDQQVSQLPDAKSDTNPDKNEYCHTVLFVTDQNIPISRMLTPESYDSEIGSLIFSVYNVKNEKIGDFDIYKTNPIVIHNTTKFIRIEYLPGNNDKLFLASSSERSTSSFQDIDFTFDSQHFVRTLDSNVKVNKYLMHSISTKTQKCVKHETSGNCLTVIKLIQNNLVYTCYFPWMYKDLGLITLDFKNDSVHIKGYEKNNIYAFNNTLASQISDAILNKINPTIDMTVQTKFDHSLERIEKKECLNWFTTKQVGYDFGLCIYRNKLNINHVDCSLATTSPNNSELCKKIHEANISKTSKLGPITIKKIERKGTKYANANIQAKYPGSNLVKDLVSPFRENVEDFIGAIRNAGGNVIISSTFRPFERAYLMNMGPKIASSISNSQNIAHEADNKQTKPVDVLWEYRGNHDVKHFFIGCAVINISNVIETTHANAQNLARSFRLVHAASLTSNHCKGLAIDMTIKFPGDGTVVTIYGKNNEAFQLKIDKSDPHFLKDDTLKRVGETYGVIRFHNPPADYPHWSINGY